MFDRLRAMLVAIIAVALLIAPCLTVLSPFGVGTAHASVEATSSVDGQHAHQSGAGDVSRGHQHLADDGTGGNSEEIPCCCNCVGWLSAKAATPMPVLSSNVSWPKQDYPTALATLPAGLSGVHGLERNGGRSPGGYFVVLPLASVYAVTGRLRL